MLLRNDSGAGLYSSPQGVTSVRSRVGPGDAAAKVKSVRMTRPAPLMAVLVLVPVLVPVVLVPVPTRMLSNLRSACVYAWSQLVYCMCKGKRGVGLDGMRTAVHHAVHVEKR